MNKFILKWIVAVVTLKIKINQITYHDFGFITISGNVMFFQSKKDKKPWLQVFQANSLNSFPLLIQIIISKKINFVNFSSKFFLFVFLSRQHFHENYTCDVLQKCTMYCTILYHIKFVTRDNWIIFFSNKYIIDCKKLHFQLVSL